MQLMTQPNETGYPEGGESPDSKIISANIGNYIYGQFNRPWWMGEGSVFKGYGVDVDSFKVIPAAEPSWSNGIPHCYIVTATALPDELVRSQELELLFLPRDPHDDLPLSADDLVIPELTDDDFPPVVGYED